MNFLRFKISFLKEVKWLVKVIGMFVTAISILNISINFYPDVFKPPDDTFLSTIIAGYVNLRDAVFAFFTWAFDFFFNIFPGYPWLRISGLFKDLITLSMVMTISMLRAVDAAGQYWHLESKVFSALVRFLKELYNGTKRIDGGVVFNNQVCRGKLQLTILFIIILPLCLVIFSIITVAMLMLAFIRKIPYVLLMNVAVVGYFMVYPLVLYASYKIPGKFRDSHHLDVLKHLLASLTTIFILIILAYAEDSVGL